MSHIYVKTAIDYRNINTTYTIIDNWEFSHGRHSGREQRALL